MPHDMYPPGHAVLLIPEAGQKWRPSNNTEAEDFMAAWCATCANDLGTEEDGGLGCEISATTFWFNIAEPEYPAEWCISAAGQPQCTAYVPKETPNALLP